MPFLDEWTVDSFDWKRWVDIDFALCSTWTCKHPPVDAFEVKHRWVFRCENCKTDLERLLLGEKLDKEVLRRMEYFLTVAVPKIRERLLERERKEEARWQTS
tara:strand:- start:559 stop:864 length:306 start_codon:yes stop_codon:yes gene_type:complete